MSGTRVGKRASWESSAQLERVRTARLRPRAVRICSFFFFVVGFKKKETGEEPGRGFMEQTTAGGRQLKILHGDTDVKI